jgi:hypothetical protein
MWQITKQSLGATFTPNPAEESNSPGKGRVVLASTLSTSGIRNGLRNYLDTFMIQNARYASLCKGPRGVGLQGVADMDGIYALGV